MAWLIGWNYRKATTISNTGPALSDYQVSITIDTAVLILAGKMRSDCGDIRFTDDDGSTPLNYWIESGQNTTSTKIWVKIPSVPTSKTIYIYYNNPSATSTSNGTNTFTFFEDFESYTADATINGINGWAVLDTYGGGSLTTVQTDYAVPPGTKSLRIGATSSGNQRNDAVKTLPSKITDDIIVEFDFRTTKPAVNSGGGDTIQWNYAGSGTIMDDAKLAAGIALGRGYASQGNYFIWHQPDGTAMTTFAASTWYKLRMDVLFSTKKSSHYINGVKYTTDVNFFDVTATGITKFSSWRYSWGNAYYTWVDNIRIRKYASPEPTILSIGSEQTGCTYPSCNFIVMESLEQSLGYLNLYETLEYINNTNNIGDNMENIKRVGYGSEPFGSSGFGGSISLATCPTVTKYSGDILTLQATPKDGTGPYYVEFRKNGTAIPGNDPLGGPYTIPSATENVTITRTYTLSDADIAGALTGTISFSVYIEDSCPTGHLTCTESCIINIGCIAPVCNFTVT